MSHWNRNAWNPNGGRYATAQQQAPFGGSYPVQQQRQQRKKDVFDSDDDSSSCSSDGESERVDVGAPLRSGYTSSRTAARGGPPPSGAKSSVLQARAQAKSQISASSSSSNGGGGGGDSPAPSRNPPRQSSSTVSASRLRSIQQQRRIDTLRASGNHAAAAIFEQAVLKANRQTSGGSSSRVEDSGNSVADDASVGSVLTFATEATDMASVRYAAQKQQKQQHHHQQYGQQRQHFHHTAQYYNVPQQTQPASDNANITPTKDEEDAVAAAADTPETLPVTPSTPLESPSMEPTSEDSNANNSANNEESPPCPITNKTSSVAVVVDSPMIQDDEDDDDDEVHDPAAVDTSYNSALSAQEEAELSVLLTSVHRSADADDEDDESIPPPPPPPPPPPQSTAAALQIGNKPESHSPSFSQASARTATTTASITTAAASPERDLASTNGTFVAINAAVAEKEARASRIAQAEEEEARRLQQQQEEEEKRNIAAAAAAAATAAAAAAAKKEQALAEAKRIAEEKAAADRARRIAEEREAQRLKAERRAKEEAALAESKRIAEEKAAAERARLTAEAEAKRLAQEKALAEAKRMEEEKAAAERARRVAKEEEARRVAEERALAEACLAEAKRMEEERAAADRARRIAEEAEAKRVAQEKALAEAERIAEEQAAAEKEAAAKRIAEEMALRESMRIAQEERRLEAERIEAERIAAEEASAERASGIAQAELEASRLQVGPEPNEEININARSTIAGQESDDDLDLTLVGNDTSIDPVFVEDASEEMASDADDNGAGYSYPSHDNEAGGDAMPVSIKDSGDATVQAAAMLDEEAFVDDTLDYSADCESELSRMEQKDTSDLTDTFEDEFQDQAFMSTHQAPQPLEPDDIASPLAEIESTPIKSVSERWVQSARKMGSSSKRWAQSVRERSSSSRSEYIEPESPQQSEAVTNLFGSIKDATSSSLPPLSPKKDGDANDLNNEYGQVNGTQPRPDYSLTNRRMGFSSDSSAGPSHLSMGSSATPVAGIATRDVSSLWDRPDSPPASDVVGYEPRASDGSDLESAALGVGVGGLAGLAIHAAPVYAPEMSPRDINVASSSAFHATLKHQNSIKTSSSIDIEVGSMGEGEVYNPKISDHPDADKDGRDPTSSYDKKWLRERMGKIIPARLCGRISCPQFKAMHFLFLLIPIIAVVLYLCYTFFVAPAVNN